MANIQSGPALSVENQQVANLDTQMLMQAAQPALRLGDFITVKDNTDFTTRFLPPPKVQFSKTVVIGQDPPAGNVVPAGTAISLTLAQKHIIPISSFNVNQKIRDMYANKDVGAVLDDIAANSTAKLILDQNKPYDTLNPNEAGPVNAFLQKQFGLSPTDPGFAAQAQSIYSDLLFLNNA